MESTIQRTTDGNGTELAEVRRAPMQTQSSSEFDNFMDVSRFEQIQRAAAVFSASQLVPECFQGNIANCIIGMEMAMRMRMSPLMLMQGTYIVHGKPGIEAKLAIALINSSGLFLDSLDYEVEGNDPRADTYRARAFAVRKSTGKRVDGPWIDWKIVKAEGWEGKAGSKWKTIPGLMFQYRAAAWFGRLHCPERLMGMQTTDEVRDSYDPQQQVTERQGQTGKTRTEQLAERFVNPVATMASTTVMDAPKIETKTEDPKTVEHVDASTGEVTQEQQPASGTPDVASIDKACCDAARAAGIPVSKFKGAFFKFWTPRVGEPPMEKNVENWTALLEAITAGKFDYDKGTILA